MLSRQLLDLSDIAAGRMLSLLPPGLDSMFEAQSLHPELKTGRILFKYKYVLLLARSVTGNVYSYDSLRGFCSSTRMERCQKFTIRVLE